MNGYDIEITTGRSTRLYHRGDEVRWELTEAARIAVEQLESTRAIRVDICDGEHAFRLWDDSIQERDEESTWYVDARIGDHRWQYDPTAKLEDYPAADDLAEKVAGLHPDVTFIWVGRTDGAEEMGSPVDDGR